MPTLVERKFASQLFLVRRLIATDEEFRKMTEDYEAAVLAVEIWETRPSVAQQFRCIAVELEDEILEFLSNHSGCADTDG